MESIPGTDGRETGWAATSDRLVPFCAIPDNHGLWWVLVLNKNGLGGIQYADTVGFVQFNTRDWPILVPDCAPVRRVSITGAVFQVEMESIPGTDGRETGVARPGQELWAFCTLRDNHSMIWDLVINTVGIGGIQYQNTVGFVPFDLTVNDPNPLPGC